MRTGISPRPWYIETIVEKGVVVATMQGGVLVQTEHSHAGCEKNTNPCGSCSQCTTKPIDGTRLFVPCSNPRTYQPGQNIRIDRAVPTLPVAALFVLGIPLGAACTVAAAWYAAAPATVESPLAIGAAIAAFCAGLGVVKIIDTLFKRRYPAALTSGHTES